MPYKDPAAARAAVKRHYDKNPEYYRERNRKAKVRKTQFIRDAKAVPCTDCGVQYPPYVMQFDHIGDDKEHNVSTMSGVSWTKIKNEISKCEVVCANCHAIRTFERRNNMPS